MPLFCLILDLDLQAALARHEEPHRLSGRAQVEVRDPTCHFQHLGHKPCLFVDNREDRLQLVTRPLPFLLPDGDDEALDPAPAERHEYAPARRKERQLVRHGIAVRLRYALHGNIDKDFRPSQNALLLQEKRLPARIFRAESLPFRCSAAIMLQKQQTLLNP